MSGYYDELLAEERELVFDGFGLTDAWELGSGLRTAALEARLPVAIGIVLGEQRVFHAALPGSSADNDAWLERKTRVALRYGRASMAVGEMFRQKEGGSFERDSRLDPALYAAHGGVVPIRLRPSSDAESGVVIGAVGVSGLPQREDHGLVVAHLRAFLPR